ncbi:MAG: TAXI family TRAP transporter solute-binding subunit [Acidobacteria bacterium]|jgi:TRAP transporter TAXI family solute receptor|nr:TAXI family TRAP transporter solute-binding subunit [Acidobacteriota bacterium]
MKLSKALVVVALGLAVACGAKFPETVVIGTGPTGGVYYPYGEALARIMTDAIPGTQFSAIATGASVENLKLMHEGKLDLALTLADTLAEAHAGTGPFAETGKVDVHSVAILYTNYTHVIVRKDSGITSIAELAGRPVSTGAVGSGTEIVADRLFLTAGINPQTGIVRKSLGLGPSVAALKDGTIDAIFLSGGAPTPAIQELAASLEIAMLPTGMLQPSLQQRFGPHMYRVHDMLAGTYPGMTSDVAVVGVPNLLVASGRLSPAFVAKLTQTLYDANETLAVLLPEVRALAWPANPTVAPTPFHPGAQQYYTANVWR